MSQANFAPYMECSLRLTVDLVNSEDPVDGTDALTSPSTLARFLRERELSSVPTPTRRDLADVRALRGRLREVFTASSESRAVAVLNELLAGSGAKPALTDHDGTWHLHYSPEGSPLGPRVAAETAMALSVVIAEEGFDRLRVCEGDRCEEVFVDGSRNRSRRYCSPQVCGNRASVAAYRARRRKAKRAGKRA